MTKLYETRQVPAETRSVQVGLVCDLCGVKSWSSWDWKTNNFEMAKVDVSCRTGTNFPEGGHGTEWEVDLCPACFKDRLVPWLESQGARVEPRDWES